MDDDDPINKTIVRIGTPFSGLNLDRDRSKKNLSTIENQGRKRFHGAFTGGFSAGYFNTVGSEEGFTPQQFVSTRTQKAARCDYLPQDFMDDEDLNMLTQAGTDLKISDKYFTQKPSSKSDSLLENFFFDKSQHSIGFKLLRAMGWKEEGNTGFRSRPTEKATFVEKNDFFGVGYDPNNSRDTEFRSWVSKCAPTTKRSELRRMKTTGKAQSRGFGLSVLENYDALDDIYSNDKIDDYDVEINPIENSPEPEEFVENSSFSRSSELKSKTEKPKLLRNNICGIKGFVQQTSRSSAFYRSIPNTSRNQGLVKAPKWFDGKHRFDLPGMRLTEDLLKFNIRVPTLVKNAISRRTFDWKSRGELLGEPLVGSSNFEKPASSKPISDSLKNAFVVGTTLNLSNPLSHKEGLSYLEKDLDAFESLKKSFINDEKKQTRFFAFLNEKLLFEAVEITQKRINISEKDENAEKREFESLFANFLNKNDSHIVLEQYKKSLKNKEVKVVHRTCIDWQPDKLLCKRFNVPVPFKEVNIKEANYIQSLIDKSRSSDKIEISKKSEKHKNVENVEKDKILKTNDLIEDHDNDNNDEDDDEKSKPHLESKQRPPDELFKAIFENSESEEEVETNVSSPQKPIKKHKEESMIHVDKNIKNPKPEHLLEKNNERDIKKTEHNKKYTQEAIEFLDETLAELQQKNSTTTNKTKTHTKEKVKEIIKRNNKFVNKKKEKDHIKVKAKKEKLKKEKQINNKVEKAKKAEKAVRKKKKLKLKELMKIYKTLKKEKKRKKMRKKTIF